MLELYFAGPTIPVKICYTSNNILTHRKLAHVGYLIIQEKSNCVLRLNQLRATGLKDT